MFFMFLLFDVGWGLEVGFACFFAMIFDAIDALMMITGRRKSRKEETK
jgi:hypothetical protein